MSKFRRLLHSADPGVNNDAFMHLKFSEGPPHVKALPTIKYKIYRQKKKRSVKLCFTNTVQTWTWVTAGSQGEAKSDLCRPHLSRHIRGHTTRTQQSWLDADRGSGAAMAEASWPGQVFRISDLERSIHVWNLKPECELGGL